jgi:hypothetical protein
MFVHSSKNLKNHEKQASTQKENVRQRNGGHEESQNVHHEVWRQNEKVMLNKKNPLAKCYQDGGKLKGKSKTAWSDDIRNPENAEYVSEVAFNKGVSEKRVTQKQFNKRYKDTLSDSTLSSKKKR